MGKGLLDTKAISKVSDHLYDGVIEIIDSAKKQVAVYVISNVLCLWPENSCDAVAKIGKNLIKVLDQNTAPRYMKYTPIWA